MFNNYIPYIGDNRYQNLKHKLALDIIRVKYYLQYKKDASITPLAEIVPLYDHTFNAQGTCYLIRGKLTFKVYLNNHHDVKANPYSDIMIEVNKDQLNDESISFMYNIIALFSGQKVNFIAGDAMNQNYCIGYVSKKYHFNTINPLYTFISEFGDNNWRNIVYIGNDLKADIDQAELTKVTEFITYHKKGICKYLKITEDEFNERYLKINEQLLKLIK